MKQNDETELKEALLGEALFFGVLGRALYNQPDKDWLNSLVSDLTR